MGISDAKRIRNLTTVCQGLDFLMSFIMKIRLKTIATTPIGQNAKDSKLNQANTFTKGTPKVDNQQHRKQSDVQQRYTPSINSVIFKYFLLFTVCPPFT